jgi:hypothetical protein
MPWVHGIIKIPGRCFCNVLHHSDDILGNRVMNELQVTLQKNKTLKEFKALKGSMP